MKTILVIMTIFCAVPVAWAQEFTTVILVRHAEKAYDEAGDPDLTKEGELRAMELVRVLSDTQIDVIYSTPFKRTEQTVKPLANARNLSIKTYNPFELETILDLIHEHKEQTILFSGHSNTTPVILNKLVGEDRYKQLDDSDYDNLYIVTYLNSDQAKVVSLEFGADSDL